MIHINVFKKISDVILYNCGICVYRDDSILTCMIYFQAADTLHNKIDFNKREGKIMDNKLFEQAKNKDILSKDLISFLLETMEYSRLSFINDAVEILKVLKIRIERGDKITDEVSNKIYTMDEFKKFVKEHFSTYIYGQVFDTARWNEKTYFSLRPCEEGYELVLSDKNRKVYKWISSLNEKFSLVYMIETKVVYIKNIKTKNYSPFISENGKYCRYDETVGKIIEIK